MIIIVVIVIDNRDNCDNVWCGVLNGNRHVMAMDNSLIFYSPIKNYPSSSLSCDKGVSEK